MSRIWAASKDKDPIRLLTGELTINGHFSEFLPEEVRPLLAEHRAR
jgi:hypothetical protein